MAALRRIEQTLDSPRGAWLWVPAALLLAVGITAASPLTITWDGYLYLQSSVHVFSDDAASKYHWIREPLYPLILQAIRTAFGTSDLALVFVQSIALVAAATLAAWTFVAGRWTRAAAVCLIALNPVAMMYAASALQTVWLLLSVAAFTALVRLAWTRPDRVVPVVALFAVTTALSALLAFQAGYLAAGAGAAMACPLVAPRIRNWPRPKRIVAIAAAIVLAGSGGFLLSRAVLAPWNAYKSEQTAGASTAANGLANTFGTTPERTIARAVGDPAGIAERIATTSLSLLSLRGGFDDENRTLTRYAFTRTTLCGHLYYAQPIEEAVADALAAVHPTCRPLVLVGWGHFLQGAGNVLVQLSSVALLLGAAVYLLRRDAAHVLALVPGLQLIVMYAAVQPGLNRYGFPVYPIGIAVAVALLDLAVQRVRSRSVGAAS